MHETRSAWMRLAIPCLCALASLAAPLAAAARGGPTQLEAGLRDRCHILEGTILRLPEGTEVRREMTWRYERMACRKTFRRFGLVSLVPTEQERQCGKMRGQMMDAGNGAEARRGLAVSFRRICLGRR